jgi:gas vesicle protein
MFEKNCPKTMFMKIASDAQAHSQSIAQQAAAAGKKIRGITDQMVETIAKKIEQAQKEWQDKIANGTSGQSGYAQATDRLKSECCALLRTIKQLNGGTLPDEWYDLWSDMQCG